MEIKIYCVFRSNHQRYSMKKGDLRNLTKSQENTCVRISFLISLFFNKIVGLRLCFPASFLKFLRKPFLQNTSRRLLLCVERILYHRGVFLEQGHWSVGNIHLCCKCTSPQKLHTIQASSAHSFCSIYFCLLRFCVYTLLFKIQRFVAYLFPKVFLCNLCI